MGKTAFLAHLQLTFISDRWKMSSAAFWAVFFESFVFCLLSAALLFDPQLPQPLFLLLLCLNPLPPKLLPLRKFLIQLNTFTPCSFPPFKYLVFFVFAKIPVGFFLLQRLYANALLENLIYRPRKNAPINMPSDPKILFSGRFWISVVFFAVFPGENYLLWDVFLRIT